MIRWIPYTFVRITLFFIAGVLTAIYWPALFSLQTLLYVLFLLLTIYILLLIYRRKINPRFDPGFVAIFIFVVAGYTQVLLSTESNDNNHLLNIQDSISCYKVVISSFPEEKENSWKEVGEVLATEAAGQWRSCTGKVLLYFDKKDFSGPYKYGDVLFIKGTPYLPSPPSNPGEFDYKRFLAFRNIYHQHYLRAGSVVFLEQDPPNLLLDYAMTARTWAQQVINKYVHGKRERAVVEALALGITDELDNDMTQAYAASGAMHVLAVSGLHIGIIYWIILLIFRPLKGSKQGRWMLAVISVLLLWFYVFITGMSPSVLRAAVMFTLVALAEPIQRRTNIYNTLAIAAFCLLMYDPYLIMAVSFQLSFMAVIGIVYFYPRLYSLWEPASQFTTMIWKLTCVSLAAQIATFSLGLLYFHQFPVYFLVSNLFVIPLSFLVLVLGILMLGFSFIAPVAGVIGYVTTFVVKALNWGVFTTESLPASIINNIYISPFQCWLLVGLIVVFVLLLEFRRFRLLYLGVGVALVFSGIQWYHYSNETGKSKLIVYNVRGHAALDLVDRGGTYFLSDSAFIKDEDAIRYYIHPGRLANGITHVWEDKGPFIREFRGCRLILWKGHKLLQVLDRNFDFAASFPVDWLIVSNNAVNDITDLKDKVNFDQLIIDSSNTLNVADELIQRVKEIHKPFHSVLHEGAYSISIIL